MQKALGLRLLGWCLVVTSLLTGAVTSVIRNQASVHDSIKSVIVSSSGQRLTTLFEGLPHDPRYSLKDILAARRALPKCGGKPDIPLLQRLFGTAVVYAGCPYVSCGGSGWLNFEDQCNTGGPCSGNYNNTTWDPTSDSGYFGPATHCGTSYACGCETYTC